MRLLSKILLFLHVFLSACAQEEEVKKGVCNRPLGLSSGSLSIRGPPSPFQGGLGNEEGAWCFSGEGVVTVDVGGRFVSGFASQGPPQKLRPKSYNHVVAYSAAHSADGREWTEFNGGTLFFDTDRNDTSDAINYFVSPTVVLTRYVRINVTLRVSGSPEICMRLEIYGCDTDVQPLTSLRALTTPKGAIEVRWEQPSADTTLEFESPSSGVFRPTGYAVMHRPRGSRTFVSTVVTSDRGVVSLEDVRLGAAYLVQLRCLVLDVSVDCGSTEIEAYPPCPEEWTGGNEYHCFLYLGGVSSFQEAREACLRMDAEDKLGKLSSLLDDGERRFMADRVLPEDVTELWLVGDMCQENDDCCNILQQDEEGTLRDAECGDRELKSAVCVRDHKGEGSRLRVSSVRAAREGGRAVSVTWRYEEGGGWKTDKLQSRLGAGGDDVTTSTHSTLEDTFEIGGLEPGTMYSLVLRPAPNIRTEEFDYKFIIIDFGDNSFGALLTPVSMSVYVVWSGSIRVTWSAAQAQSVTGPTRESAKYSVSHQVLGAAPQEEAIVEEGGLEFRLSPLRMRKTYVFRLGCLFADVYHPCGVASVTTDPPAHVQREAGGLHTLYEVIGGRGLSWSEAEEDCARRSGHLTSVLDEAEGRTLLAILPPTKGDKVWTGAKLRRNGTSYWTDGNKITFLPMAKNSGVLPNKDSCCRALRESGRLRLEGGECGDRLRHVCKYSVKDIMVAPTSLSAVSQTPHSFRFAWQSPAEGWLPTYHVVSVCETSARCRVENVTDGRREHGVENLSEFTAYEVTVRAVLQPLNVTTRVSKKLYTYPKSSVRIKISATGGMEVETPMLVAMGMEQSKVTATLYQGERVVAVAEGGVEKVHLSGLVPEENYRLVVTDSNKEWTNEMNFDAMMFDMQSPLGLSIEVSPASNTCVNILLPPAPAPSCVSPSDARVGSSCCRHVGPAAFDGCQEVGPGGRMWVADSSSEVEDLSKWVEVDANIWVGRPTSEGVAEMASEAECSVRSGDGECCSYVIAQKRIVCSYCCEGERGVLCAYDVTVNLGQVSDLLPTSIGNASIAVRWSNPADVTWDIQRHEVQWRSTETEGEPTVTSFAEEGKKEMLMEELEYGTEYEVTVTPLGKKEARGKEAKLVVTTLDPRPELSVVVRADGAVSVGSPLLAEKGRGGEEVDLALLTTAGGGEVVAVVRGVAEEVQVTGLEPGKEYVAEMTPAATGRRPFKYRSSFWAFPSCAADQIQDGLVCVWSADGVSTKREASEHCRRSGQGGQLLDYRTQKAMSPAAKARLAARLHRDFWVDFTASKTSAALVDAEECAGARESDVMCCTFEATSGGELNDIKCTCCQDSRPVACKRENKVNLGSIGDITVDEVTRSSLRLAWTLASEECKWRQPSFLVTWEPANGGRVVKREANEMVVKEAETTIADLEPGTQYRVGVAPYTHTTQVGGAPKEITVTTRAEIIAAGFTDTGCTTAILKISCCVSVILSTSFTVFVFIATRMFDLDCVAQMFMELSLLGAYLCILVSSAHTYSMDSECARASASVCVAVAGLLQFFFQCVFLFLLLESGVICGALKGFVPPCAPRTPIALFAVGFGVPAILNIIIAAIESDEYTDKRENCWLNVRGRAVLPSVLPVLLFSACTFCFLVTAFDADEPREDLPKAHQQRARVFLKTRWSCFAVFALTIVSYATGLFGANSDDPALDYVFFGFSVALALLLPLLRIRCDDQVKYQLRRGLFSGLRDDVGGIRVTPAPEDNDLLQMSEYTNPKHTPNYSKKMAFKRPSSLADSDIVSHR